MSRKTGMVVIRKVCLLRLAAGACSPTKDNRNEC